MERVQAIKLIQSGNTDINVVLNNKAQGKLLSYLHDLINDETKTEQEKQFVGIINEMITAKEITSLNLKLDFINE